MFHSNLKVEEKSVLNQVGVVILAGGLGTRLKDLYPDVPKPMIEVYGVPFLEWIIRYFSLQGIKDYSISAGYKGNVIKKYLDHRMNDGLNISLSIEESPQGTAGGFLGAVPALTDKKYLLVTNGDSLVLSKLRPIFGNLMEDEFDGAIVGIEMDDCSRYGSLVYDEKGNLKNFLEKQKGFGLINAGLYIFSRKVIENFPKTRPLSFEYDVFPQLLKSNRKIKVIKSSGCFIDIGTPETVVMATEFIKKNESNWFHVQKENYDH